MNKRANTQFPLHELLAERWSPRAFSKQAITEDTLMTLLEAARWAPSCFNAQPWRFIVARKEETEGFAALLDCLVPANQTWSQHAGALLLSVAQNNFERNGKPNRHALHDVGLAVSQLTIQAQAEGIGVHQMAGFERDKSIKTLKIPEGFEPVAMLALGYFGDPETLPDDYKARELAPRERKSLDALVFRGAWKEG